MPPHTFLTDALHRYMYLLTVLIAASVVVSVGFAVAGRTDPECRGNSPKKICPKLSPASGATISGEVAISAEVPETVVGIEFRLNESLLGTEDTTPPYEVRWDTTTVPNGQHTISAVARDAEAKTSTSESIVEVSNATRDTTSPSLQLTNPAESATVFGQTSVSADASDNVGVAGVQFKLDGASLGGEDTSAPYAVSWDTTKASNGSHTVTAVARDAAGNSSSSQRGVNVSNASTQPPPGDTTAPSVQLTNPAAGASVSGQTSVSADASDNVGVAGVQFKLDGASLGSEDTSAPYAVSWDTTKASNGSHTLTAVARDAAGNNSNTARTVNVSNVSNQPPPSDTTAPTVQLTNPAAGATVSGQTSVSASASDNVGVVGVQFKLDGGNLGAEDTSAPYSVGWDTTKASNGSHTLTAVARDAAGNNSNAARTVNVSNVSNQPPPSDTTAPTVQLTNPAAGATVSGQTSVSASASDNVGVVGVQFKRDGGNIGAEDTSAPYVINWDTTNAPNGLHTLTAVARDAAGNSSISQRTVNVSNSSSAEPRLTWRPPALSNPVTIDVTNANNELWLDKSKDYVLRIREKLVGTPGLFIDGGHNVVVIGGHIEMNTAGTSSYWDRTAVKVRYATGVVHLEGLLINGAALADGIVTAAPDATLQIQNVRVENVHATGSEHADCLQTQAGLGALRIDRFTCSSELQGLFLDNTYGAVGPCDIRNTNIVGLPGKYLFWQTSPNVGPITLQNVWLHMGDPWADFGYWVYPNRGGNTYNGQIDLNRKAVISADGTYLTFTNSNISGRIYKGLPSGGGFVPAAGVGLGYASPGYN